MSKYKQRNLVDENYLKDLESEESEEENEEEQQKFEEYIMKKRQTNFATRHSVSAEAFGIFNKKKEFIPKFIPKEHEQIERIKNKLNQSVLFSSLDDNEINTVIDAMKETKFIEGQYIIKQTEPGECMYLVESGKMECYKIIEKGKPPKYLKSYSSGDSFGELALLYDSPRQASIIAVNDCVLWELDRDTFNNIVKESAIKKMETYMSFIVSVEIFQTIELYELGLICDAIRVEKFKKDEFIIKVGEIGNKFYIVQDGQAVISMILQEGDEEQVIREIKSGDYFGELALIKNEPRSANVVAKSDCTLLTLDRYSFNRLLGPIENLLIRNSDAYLKFMRKSK